MIECEKKVTPEVLEEMRRLCEFLREKPTDHPVRGYPVDPVLRPLPDLYRIMDPILEHAQIPLLSRHRLDFWLLNIIGISVHRK